MFDGIGEGANLYYQDSRGAGVPRRDREGLLFLDHVGAALRIGNATKTRAGGSTKATQYSRSTQYA